jgi:hypothetical protein
MRTIASFAEANPKTYLAGCLALGFILRLALGFIFRLALCHGDMGLFFDPLYPLIHR